MKSKKYRTIELLQSNSITIDEIKSQLSTKTDFLCRLYKQALDNPENVKSALDLETTKELGRMRQYHSILDTIITLAPMIGILGTIVGIILSFEFLGSSQLQDPKLVTNGIAQALITTAAGLSIAILTLIPYNFFNSQVARASKLMEIYLSKLEIILSKRNTPNTSDTITITSPKSNNSQNPESILENS